TALNACPPDENGRPREGWGPALTDGGAPGLDNPGRPFDPKREAIRAENGPAAGPAGGAEPLDAQPVGPWPPRPPEPANRPLARRERWARLADELQASGLPWHEAERRAFKQVSAEDDPGPGVGS